LFIFAIKQKKAQDITMAEISKKTEKLDFEKVWLMFKETDRKFQETDRAMKETDRKQKETDKQIKELGKQIGGLGNKFGNFTEHLFIPSIVNILENEFNCTEHFAYYNFQGNGKTYEIDVFGISETAYYLIEIKNTLNDEAIEQLTRTILEFKEHSKVANGKDTYGIIAAAIYHKDSLKKVIDSGLYFISTANDIAKLKVPKGFKPKKW